MRTLDQILTKGLQPENSGLFFIRTARCGKNC